MLIYIELSKILPLAELALLSNYRFQSGNILFFEYSFGALEKIHHQNQFSTNPVIFWLNALLRKGRLIELYEFAHFQWSTSNLFLYIHPGSDHG